MGECKNIPGLHLEVRCRRSSNSMIDRRSRGFILMHRRRAYTAREGKRKPACNITSLTREMGDAYLRWCLGYPVVSSRSLYVSVGLIKVLKPTTARQRAKTRPTKADAGPDVIPPSSAQQLTSLSSSHLLNTTNQANLCASSSRPPCPRASIPSPRPSARCGACTRPRPSR